MNKNCVEKEKYQKVYLVSEILPCLSVYLSLSFSMICFLHISPHVIENAML